MVIKAHQKLLRILQYNVRHKIDKVMYPMLNDERYREFNILAVQEPWENPGMPTSVNPSNSPFYLVYQLRMGARVCFYINKGINADC